MARSRRPLGKARGRSAGMTAIALLTMTAFARDAKTQPAIGRKTATEGAGIPGMNATPTPTAMPRVTSQRQSRWAVETGTGIETGTAIATGIRIGTGIATVVVRATAAAKRG